MWVLTGLEFRLDGTVELWECLLCGTVTIDVPDYRKRYNG